jgi:hypothetical protein
MGCERDECRDSQVGTSWCVGTVPTRCEVTGGEGGFHNGLLSGPDCAKQGLGCVADGKHAACGFPERDCDASDRNTKFCENTWISFCAASAHPQAITDCAPNSFGLGEFCVARASDAVCSPSLEACESDAPARCISGAFASCDRRAWVATSTCDEAARR